jgi:hypothetical protein
MILIELHDDACLPVFEIEYLLRCVEKLLKYTQIAISHTLNSDQAGTTRLV